MWYSPSMTTTPTPQETTTIWVCEDCLFVHANGETGNEEPDCVPLSKVSDTDSLAFGIDWEDHWEKCPNRLARENVEECDCETIPFSSSPCPACGTALAGSRHGMTLFHN